MSAGALAAFDAAVLIGALLVGFLVAAAFVAGFLAAVVFAAGALAVAAFLTGALAVAAFLAAEAFVAGFLVAGAFVVVPFTAFPALAVRAGAGALRALLEGFEAAEPRAAADSFFRPPAGVAARADAREGLAEPAGRRLAACSFFVVLALAAVPFAGVFSFGFGFVLPTPLRTPAVVFVATR